MTRVPIACTLTAVQAKDRVGEWREFLARGVDERQLEGTVARLRLRPGDDVLVTAVDLAQREKSCCGFFSFSIELDTEARWLRVEVPADATPILADLMALGAN
jgi:hypothetical protein